MRNLRVPHLFFITPYCYQLIEYHRQHVGHDGRRDDADKSRHHERVVQQVFADDSRTRSVEVHRCNI